MRSKTTEINDRVYTGTFEIFLNGHSVGAVRMEMYELTKKPFNENRTLRLLRQMELIETDGNKKTYRCTK